jgi:hypothetical protein
MALSAFDDKQHPPQEDDLATTLGKSYAHWQELRRLVAAHFPPLTEEWGFASKSTGWGLRLKQPKRTVLYMTPCAGHFLASFALGEKAVRAAHEAALPAAILAVIDTAPKYAEGRGVRIPVRSAREVRQIEKLALIKMAN